jgi:hypothetical protein
MKVLIFGSRSLTGKHLHLMRLITQHALLAEPPDLGAFLAAEGMDAQDLVLLPESESLVLVNGDGPPGKERGAIGADKLAVLACLETWPERRKMRWFPPEPKGEETWAQAAARRNQHMVASKPDRVYCVHTDLDASKGSSMTADFLKAAAITFWYVQVTTAGALVGVEERR